MESGRSPSKTCRSSSHIFRFATCPANATGQNAKENFVIRRFRMVIGSKTQCVTFLIEERKPPYPRPPSERFYPVSACVKTNNAKLSLHFHLHHLLHGFLRTDIYPMFLQEINPALPLNPPSHSYANLRTSLERNPLSSIASRLIQHEHGVVLHLHARHVVLRDINPRHFHVRNVLEIPRKHVVILA